MIYVTNGFSINMIPANLTDFNVAFRKIAVEDVANILRNNNFESYIGHQDLANIVSFIVGVNIPYNRGNLLADKGAKLLICQYRGPRLPEGATMLPEGAVIEFYLAEIN